MARARIRRGGPKRLAARCAAVALALALAPSAFAQRSTYSNPVVASDYPDPSVVRVGDDFYAVATAGSWEPIFTIRHSRDLVNWTAVGSVFASAPAWAERDFWAPEIVRYRDRFYVYYTARKKDGPLCVAVASAERATGPYTDHGPLVCQPIGSIDADMVEDREGRLFLLWKEDGNSREAPTPIWAQPLAKDGITLDGAPTELIRNDVAWEGGVVEGPFVLWRGGWYYLFYSGNACCGRECDYALGVARAREFLGPWEKNPGNPILAANATWRCPGHGTIVETSGGDDYLLYHAYRNAPHGERLGRAALLDRIAWRDDGWPEINNGRGPSAEAAAPAGSSNARAPFVDEFDALPLDATWRWPIGRKPELAIVDGALRISARAGDARNPAVAVVGRHLDTASYEATARVRRPAKGAVAGLAALSWGENGVGIDVGAELRVWRSERGRVQTLESVKLPRGAPRVSLKMISEAGERYRFAYSLDGARWLDVRGTVDARFLDFTFVVLAVGGREPVGLFEAFSIDHKR